MVALGFTAYAADLDPADYNPPANDFRPPACRPPAWEGAYHDALNDLRAAGRGGRNNELNRAAFVVGRMVAGGLIPEEQARSELLSAARLIGLDRSEAAGTINSGLRGGFKEPWRESEPRSTGRPWQRRQPAPRPALRLVGDDVDDRHAAAAARRAVDRAEPASTAADRRVMTYLAGRGITDVPGNVLFSGDWNGAAYLFTTPDGEAATYQRVDLDRAGEIQPKRLADGREVKRPFADGAKLGNSMFIAQGDAAVSVLVDGVEDALAARQATGWRSFAAGGKGRFRHVVDHLRRGDRLVIGRDRDGTDNSEYLTAERALRAAGIRYVFVDPPDDLAMGDLSAPKDVNDALIAGGNECVRRWLVGAAEKSFVETEAYEELGSREQDLEQGSRDWRDKIPGLVSPTSWVGRTAPPVDWLVDGWLERGEVTFLVAPGGTGKSMIAQQLCASVGTGSAWLGLATAKSPALFVGCEDREAEMWRRQDRIAAATGIAHYELENVQYWFRRGMSNVFQDYSEKNAPPPPHDQVISVARSIGAGLIVIDGLSHIFSGNENDPNVATQFVNDYLIRIAEETGAAVLVLHHTAKDGVNYRGTTAWPNSVRCMLQLVPDPEQRGAMKLVKVKANHAKAGDEVQLLWHRDIVYPAAAIGPDEVDRIEASSRGAQAKRAFMAAFTRLFDAGVNQLNTKTRGNYAPKTLRNQPELKGFRTNEIADAMFALIADGALVEEPFGPPSKSQTRLVTTRRADTGG